MREERGGERREGEGKGGIAILQHHLLKTYLHIQSSWQIITNAEVHWATITKYTAIKNVSKLKAHE